MTIKIVCKVVKEYFNIANVEHYTILGTSFLRKMGIILDFRSPGIICMGNKVILTRKVAFDRLKDTDENIATMSNIFYRNISVFYFNIKDLIFCVPSVRCVLCGVQGICIHRWMWHLYLSMRNVTKHRDRSPSSTGVNWVSNGAGIDFIEYMHYKSVCFYGSLESTVIVDS